MGDLLIGAMLWSAFTLPITALLLCCWFGFFAAGLPRSRRFRRAHITVGIILITWLLPGLVLILLAAVH